MSLNYCYSVFLKCLLCNFVESKIIVLYKVKKKRSILKILKIEEYNFFNIPLNHKNHNRNLKKKSEQNLNVATSTLSYSCGIQFSI